MTYLVQTLPKNNVLMVTVSTPIMQGEASRIYKTLKDKLERRSENETIHIVLDLTKFKYTERIPVERYIKVMSKIYEQWHYRRTLVMWIGVDGIYVDVAKYLVQRWLLPIYLKPSINQIHESIDVMFGDTAEFVNPEETHKK